MTKANDEMCDSEIDTIESIIALYREGSATREDTLTDLRLAGVHPFDAEGLLDEET